MEGNPMDHGCVPWRYMPMYGLPPHVQGDSITDFAAVTDKQTLLPSNLPNDPRQWSHQQVCLWLDWCVQHFSLPPIDLDNFHMNGKALCLLTKGDIKDRVPRVGDVLFNSLHILVLKSTPTPNVSNLLLGQAAAAVGENNKGSVNLQRLWNRSVSSDFHNIGYIMPETANGGDVDSTVILSPAPSTEGASDKAASDGKGQTDNPALPGSGSTESGSEEEDEPVNGHKDNSCYVTTETSVQQAHSGNVHTAPLHMVASLQQDYPQEKSVRLLWDFLQQLLNDPQQRYRRCIAWKEKGKGVFKIVDPHQLAYLWGMQKNHLNMNFDKMSRALRYYYRVKILQKEPGERHCYRFLRHPTELRNCKQRSLLNKNGLTSPVSTNENEGVLNMSVKDEWTADLDAE